MAHFPAPTCQCPVVSRYNFNVSERDIPSAQATDNRSVARNAKGGLSGKATMKSSSSMWQSCGFSVANILSVPYRRQSTCEQLDRVV